MRVGWAYSVLFSILILGSAAYFQSVQALPYETPHIELVNPNTLGSEFFGFDVDIGSNHVGVGNPIDSTVAENAGAVFVYDLNGNLLHTLQNPVPSVNNNFGLSLAIDGNSVFVGTSSEIFSYDLVSGNLIPGFQPQFGNFAGSIAVDGNNLVVGGSELINNPIRAKLFDKTTGNLVLDFDFSGSTDVEIDGNLVAITKPGNRPEVLVYDISSCDTNSDQFCGSTERL